MACGAGKRLASTIKTGSNEKRWLADLTIKLGGDFTKFASHIGFNEEQVQLIEGTGDHVHQLLIEEWLYTIGRHTTKYQHVIYTALVTIKRKDLLDTYFKKGTPDKYSENIWEDFLEELHAVDVTNLESKDKDEKLDVQQKRKKKKKKTKEKKFLDIGKTGRDEKEKNNTVLNEKAASADFPMRIPSEVMTVDENENDNVAFEDNKSLPDDSWIITSKDAGVKAAVYEKDKEALGDHNTFRDDSGILKSSEIENKAEDNVALGEDASIPEKIIPSKASQHGPFINIYAEEVVVGDHGIIHVNKSSRASEDEKDENIRKELTDILQSKGAVGGGDSKKNKVNLQSLESYFKRRNSGKHFESMYSKSLLTYLHQSSDYFKMTKQSGQWFVHIDADTTLKKGAQTQRSKHRSTKPLPKSNNDPCGRSEVKTTVSNQAFTRPMHDHKKNSTYVPNKCTQFGDFLEKVGRFRDGKYLLMISKMDFIKHEEALTNIPWLCVFDFDDKSFTEGLFFRIEDVMRAKRGAVYPCTWKDPPNIQDFGTEWCFVSGSVHTPDSSTPDTCKEWYSHIQASFAKHIKALTQLLDTITQLTVIAFLPEDTNTGNRFYKVLSVLRDSIRPPPQDVVITDNLTATQSLIGLIEPNYTLPEKFEHFFHDLSTNVRLRHESKQSTYELPTADGLRPTRIDHTAAASFRDSMQVLYLDNPFHTDLPDLTASEEEEILFFKGGTLTWKAYYNNGPEHFYFARDICPTIVNDIQRDFIDNCKAGVVTIYHAPGAGGTTLGQNILWNLHALTPCVQVRSDTLAIPKKIARHINTLYRETRLPIVVLFDCSSNDNTFDNIQEKCNDICVIFIHLKRVPDKGKMMKKHEYFLPGTLSPHEANCMGPKFIRCCGDDSKKKDQIQKLVNEVVSGQKHHLIEFGLVTYRHEFKGVGPYVSAYLKLDKQSKELDNCRKVLGYLSLVQIFGQGVMPCQLFGTMLGKSADYMFRYEKFPSLVKEFTVPVDSDFAGNSVRICHYLIAKEILDQILSDGSSVENCPELSIKAKRSLKQFVLEFIEDLKIRQDQMGHISKTVFDIILQTFIYREDRSTVNQQGKKRSNFSTLIECIPSEQPFTERLQVMETLAKSFPGSPSLWAHLGRAYSILRPNETKKTESYFQNAIIGCQEEQHLSVTDNDENDTVLSFVFHMYGIFYLKQIRAEIAHCNSCSELQFQDFITRIFSLSQTACKSFEDSRRLRFAGFQEYLGCFGEIDVRLAICEFLKFKYRFETIPELLEISQDIRIKSFVEESLSHIQQLFIQSYNVVDHSQIDDEFYKRVALYNALFRGMVPNRYLDMINVPDGIPARAAKIAAIKLKYGKDSRLGTVDDITDERDIKCLISLLEKNIDDIRKTNMVHSKTGTDHDLLDWIHAIRLPNQKQLYTVEDVLANVRCWFNLAPSPYARLYLFVLLFVCAVPLDGPCNQKMLREAISMTEDKEWLPAAKALTSPERPREWLGKETGIRYLLPGKTFKCDGGTKYIHDDVARYKLQVMKGTIRPPNTYRNEGCIGMSVTGNIDVLVKVHFCPIRTKEHLVGNGYANTRVEFTLAFTPHFGFEAYNVLMLRKSTCGYCGCKIEMVSVEKSRICKCGETVENEFPVAIGKDN